MSMVLTFFLALIPGAMPAPMILNQNRISALANGHSLAERLRLASLAVKSRFSDSKNIRYLDIAGSAEFKTLEAVAGELHGFDLETLRGRDERIAFWANVYNSLIIHAVTLEMQNQPMSSVWDVVGFFDRRAYIIGGHVFTLNEIEHGILRANRKPPYTLYHPFSLSDPRLRFALSYDEFDPRIHFALNCASHSCPPFAFLKSTTLDRDLENAKCGFIRSETKIEGTKVFTSKIFDWYAVDFKPTVRDFLLTCLDGELRQKLEERQTEIRFSDYDWRLNHVSDEVAENDPAIKK